MRSLLQWTVGSVVAGGIIVGIMIPKDENDLFRSEKRIRSDSLFAEWTSNAEQSRVFKRVVDRIEAREEARALPPVRAEEPLVRIDPRLGKESTERLRRRFDSELLLEAGGGVPKYPLALVVRIDSTNPTGIYYRAVALPERAGDPCTIVLTVPFNQRNNLYLVATQRLLGTCAFYAAHGAPGPEVERWLRDSRFAAAQYLQRPGAFSGDTSRIELRISWYGFGADAASLVRCRTGIEADCLRFISPDPSRPAIFEESRGGAAIDRSALTTVAPGTDVYLSGSWGGETYQLRSAMLGNMAAELGPERFGALWRDPRPLEESFRANEGRTLGAWVATYVAERTEPYVAGPGLRTVPILLSLALLVGATLLAVFSSPRRLT